MPEKGGGEELVLEHLGSSHIRTVGLFVDGPAPLAKLEVQRARRESALKKLARSDTGKCRITKPQLTAGSDVMQGISDGLSAWSRARLKMKMHAETRFVCSGHAVTGEAEIKMARCISEDVVGGGDEDAVGNQERQATGRRRVLLVGGDTDLLMIGACASASAEVYVLPRLPDEDGSWHDGDSAWSVTLNRAYTWASYGPDGAFFIHTMHPRTFRAIDSSSEEILTRRLSDPQLLLSRYWRVETTTSPA